MSEDIIQYIKDQLARGQTISQVMVAMQKSGYTDIQINDLVQRSMQIPSPALTSTIQPAPPPSNISSTINTQPVTPTASTTPPTTTSALSNRIDITKAFVVIGAILITLATVVVIFSQWHTVGPFVKIMFMVIPMLMLYGLAVVLNKYDHYKEISNIMLGLGSFMLPFSIGTIICQTKIIEQVDPLVIFLSAITSLPIFLTTEHVFKKPFMSIFSILAIFTAYVSLFMQAQDNLEIQAMLWIALALSMAILGLGFLFNRLKLGGSIYLVVGTFTTLLLLLINTLYTLNQQTSVSADTNLIIFSSFGFLYLLVSSLYYYLYKLTGNYTLYILKRFIEELSPIGIIVPYFILGFDKTQYIVVALVLSIAYVLISTKIIINTLLFLGSVGIIITIITFSIRIFPDSTAWPIILFISGFAAIGIGLLIRKIYKDRKAEGNIPVFLGLGADPDIVRAEHHVSTNKIILFIVLTVFLGPSLLSGLFYLVGNSGRSSYQTDNTTVPNATVETYEQKGSTQTIPESQTTITPSPTATTTTTTTNSTTDQAGLITYIGYMRSMTFSPSNHADVRQGATFDMVNMMMFSASDTESVDMLTVLIANETVFEVNGAVLPKDDSLMTALTNYPKATIKYQKYTSTGTYNIAKKMTFYQ